MLLFKLMKSTIILLSIFLSAMLVVSGCEEPVTIDTDQAPQQLIIEGLITNEFKQHTIKISQTADFYDTGNTPRISEATVTVSDNENNIYTFIETDPGIYLSAPFAGVVGRTYDLEILSNGETITASEELLPVTTIDSLEQRLFEDLTEENNIDSFGVFMYTIEPQDEENFYLFKFYRNGFWLNEEGEDITVTDDVAVGEEIEGIEVPYIYLRGDTARVEMYSLSRKQFVFWADVANLIFSDGGVFAPLPANPRSNLVGNAIGIFQVSSIEAAEIIIE